MTQIMFPKNSRCILVISCNKADYISSGISMLNQMHNGNSNAKYSLLKVSLQNDTLKMPIS